MYTALSSEENTVTEYYQQGILAFRFCRANLKNNNKIQILKLYDEVFIE